MRQETKYNKVVNISEDGEISVLDYTFDHGDGFKGATGSRFYPVSKTEYKRLTTLKAVAEKLEECVSIEDISDEFKFSETGREYKNPYLIWAKVIKAAGEIEEFMFDTSYSNIWNYLREVTGLSEKEAYIFECVGGGRMFSADFQGNVNPELSEIIRQFESNH